jgi:predicted phosphoribosyltransferase
VYAPEQQRESRRQSVGRHYHPRRALIVSRGIQAGSRAWFAIRGFHNKKARNPGVADD